MLAVNSATASFHGFRLAHAVASSHIVITEPVPDVLEELGWTGGEPIADGRTLLHYLRTTRDGRIAFGWGGGRMGFGGRRLGRLEIDPRAARKARADLLRLFPQLAGRRVTHAWGGPIDVSPTHLPIFGSHGHVHHGFGFTGNGVGPSYLGGEISRGSRLTGGTCDAPRARRPRTEAPPASRSARRADGFAPRSSAPTPPTTPAGGGSRHPADDWPAATAGPAPSALTAAPRRSSLTTSPSRSSTRWSASSIISGSWVATIASTSRSWTSLRIRVIVEREPPGVRLEPPAEALVANPSASKLGGS